MRTSIQGEQLHPVRRRTGALNFFAHRQNTSFPTPFPLLLTMRQSDFILSKALARRKVKRHRALFLRLTDAPLLFTLRSIKKARQSSLDVLKINLRSISISTHSFNINIYSDESALRDFRFRARDIAQITSAMGWTHGKTQRNGYKCVPFTACCILFRQLAYPCRWKDLEYVFGMRSSALSEVFWEVVETFIETQGHLITDLRQAFLASRAELYANSIKNAGAPLDSCVGFIDCTKIQMCRPGGHGSIQRSCYSGHKRYHCLIYQTLTTPDGLIFHMYGPEVGRRHDLTLLRESGLGESLSNCLNVNGRQFYIFGDAAYMLRPWIQVAFPSIGATEAHGLYNALMSAVRVTVEWNYKDLKQLL